MSRLCTNFLLFLIRQYIDNVTDYLAPLRATNEQMFVLSDSVVIPGNNSLNFTLNTSALTAYEASAVLFQ
jgi:hypothetical protein